MTLKQCTKCGQSKPLNFFHLDRGNADGRTRQCSECRNAHARATSSVRKEYRKRITQAKIREGKCRNCLSRDFVHAHLCEYCHDQQVRLRKALRHKSYTEGTCRDCEKPAITDRRMCADCSVKNNQRTRQWEKQNPDKVNQRSRIRYAKNKGNGGIYTTDQWLELCDLFSNRCLDCGKPKPLSADHVVPVSRGGTSDISNIQPLCRECNSSKGHRVIIDYRLKSKTNGRAKCNVRGRIYETQKAD